MAWCCHCGLGGEGEVECCWKESSQKPECEQGHPLTLLTWISLGRLGFGPFYISSYYWWCYWVLTLLQLCKLLPAKSNVVLEYFCSFVATVTCPRHL